LVLGRECPRYSGRTCRCKSQMMSDPWGAPGPGPDIESGRRSGHPAIAGSTLSSRLAQTTSTSRQRQASWAVPRAQMISPDASRRRFRPWRSPSTSSPLAVSVTNDPANRRGRPTQRHANGPSENPRSATEALARASSCCGGRTDPFQLDDTAGLGHSPARDLGALPWNRARRSI
jgi:hypothetical protein